MRHAAIALALVVVTPHSYATQAQAGASLGELARKVRLEREARQGRPVARSFSDHDLHRPFTNEPVVAADDAESTPTPEAAPASGAKTEKTPEEIKAEREQSIDKELAEHRRLAGVIRNAMGQAQAELDDLSVYTFGTRRAALQKLVDDGQVELKKELQAIADLEEEARRLGH